MPVDSLTAGDRESKYWNMITFSSRRVAAGLVLAFFFVSGGLAGADPLVDSVASQGRAAATVPHPTSGGAPRGGDDVEEPTNPKQTDEILDDFAISDAFPPCEDVPNPSSLVPGSKFTYDWEGRKNVYHVVWAGHNFLDIQVENSNGKPADFGKWWIGVYIKIHIEWTPSGYKVEPTFYDSSDFSHAYDLSKSGTAESAIRKKLASAEWKAAVQALKDCLWSRDSNGWGSVVTQIPAPAVCSVGQLNFMVQFNQTYLGQAQMDLDGCQQSILAQVAGGDACQVAYTKFLIWKALNQDTTYTFNAACTSAIYDWNFSPWFIGPTWNINAWVLFTFPDAIDWSGLWGSSPGGDVYPNPSGGTEPIVLMAALSAGSPFMDASGTNVVLFNVWWLQGGTSQFQVNCNIPTSVVAQGSASISSYVSVNCTP